MIFRVCGLIILATCGGAAALTQQERGEILDRALTCLGRPVSVEGGSTEPSIPRGALAIVTCFERTVPGSDIAPNLKNSVSALLPPIKAGDVVLFRRGGEEWIKRLVGLPGGRIQVSAGRLLVDGTQVKLDAAGDWDYTSDGAILALHRFRETLPDGRSYYVLKATDTGEANNTPEYYVPEGGLFVLGDNRDESADSRFFGFVNVNSLVGIIRSFQLPVEVEQR